MARAPVPCPGAPYAYAGGTALPPAPPATMCTSRHRYLTLEASPIDTTCHDLPTPGDLAQPLSHLLCIFCCRPALHCQGFYPVLQGFYPVLQLQHTTSHRMAQHENGTASEWHMLPSRSNLLKLPCSTLKCHCTTHQSHRHIHPIACASPPGAQVLPCSWLHSLAPSPVGAWDMGRG